MICRGHLAFALTVVGHRGGENSETIWRARRRMSICELWNTERHSEIPHVHLFLGPPIVITEIVIRATLTRRCKKPVCFLHVFPITAFLKTFGSDGPRLFLSSPQQVCIHLSGIGFRFEDKSQNMKITISCFIACYCNVEELLFSEDHNYIVINVICSEKALASRYIYSWSLCQCLLSLNGNFTLFARKIPWVVPGDYGP